MKTAEKAGRIFFTLIGILGIALLFLPQIGISVDSIMSGSMEPTLKTGGIVLTDTRDKIPEIGDIVTYQMGESKVTHRVVRKEGKNYVTKGDANNREDPAVVSSEQVIGKVIFTVPFLGYIAFFVRQKTVLAILAAMILQELILLAVQWKGERDGERAEKIYEK